MENKLPIFGSFDVRIRESADSSKQSQVIENGVGEGRDYFFLIPLWRFVALIENGFVEGLTI